MLNEIILDGDLNNATYFGFHAGHWSYRPELQAVLNEVKNTMRSDSENRFFVYEGSILRAAQPTLELALKYMDKTRVLIHGKVGA